MAGLREGQLAIARNARLDCQVTGEIGDVPLPLTVDEGFEGVHGFTTARCVGCFDEFRQGEVIHGVDVACAQGQ